ncbi:MAG: hypothetical protein OIN83_07820 [Candidatus Methanoperedens sp.]|nr:hypothetical protein [Candidatus Methanoperedens sp.]
MKQTNAYVRTFSVFICFLLSATQIYAHSPLIPGINDGLNSATFISDPTKSWAIYGELHEGKEAQYYRFDINETQKIHISLLKSTDPDNRDFVPSFALMGPGLQGQGDLPAFVEVPAGANANVISGVQPTLGTYEPFSASSFYSLADLEIDAPVSGSYYIAVYEPRRGGQYSLAVGDREAFSLSEWIFIPIKLLSIYQWGGQSLFIIFLPIIATLAIGLWIFRRKGWMPKTPFEWAGILAGLLFFGSGVLFLFEMFLALTRVSPVPEIVITIILGILPIILGIAVIRIIVKNREKVVMGKRAFLFVIGILAFFLWAGFLLGPALAIAASFMPQKKNYNLRKSIH